MLRHVMLLMLVILAGCAPPATAPPAPSSPTAAPTAVPRPEPTLGPPETTVPEPAAAPGALVVWVAEQGAAFDAAARALEVAAAEAGVPLVLVAKGPDGLRADLLAARLVGEPLPDLLWGSGNELAALRADGLLAPVEPPQPDDALLPAVVSGARADGQTWGVPLAADGFLLLLYNQELLEAPPATTDDLIVQARAATGDGRYGLVAAWAEPRWLAAWLSGMGGALTSPDGTTPTLNTPEMIVALDLLRELRPAGPPPPSTYRDGRARFASGEAAMAIDGSWEVARLREALPELPLGIAPMPQVPATGRVAAAPLGGTYLMQITGLASARSPEVAALASALLEPAVQARLAVALGRLPALQAALADPAVQADALLAAGAAGARDAPGLPPTAALRCAWEAVGLGLPPILLGEIPREEGAQRMQQAAEACVARAP